MTAAVALLALGLSAFAILVRLKNRALWRSVFRLDEEVRQLHAALVVVRKEIVLAGLKSATRLPAKMPSQNGEDLLLWNFFDRKTAGFYVEVGAYDGVAFSNTYFFEAIGWKGVLVEAGPDFFLAAVSSRPNSRVVHAAAGSRAGSARFSIVEGGQGVGTLSSGTPDLPRIEREGGRVFEIDVSVLTLDSILEEVREPIDFISIDVEGSELDVLEGFDIDRFRPRVLIIEDNSNGTDLRVAEWLARHGYVERARVEQNVFYARREETREFGWHA